MLRRKASTRGSACATGASIASRSSERHSSKRPRESQKSSRVLALRARVSACSCPIDQSTRVGSSRIRLRWSAAPRARRSRRPRQWLQQPVEVRRMGGARLHRGLALAQPLSRKLLHQRMQLKPRARPCAAATCRRARRAPATARAATARAASGEKPPRNTDSRASTSRPPASSSRHDCSNTTSMLAWRAGCAASTARSSSVPCRSSVAIASHDSTRVHAAASSSASGSPSTWRQMSTIAAASAAGTSAGSTRCAARTKRRAASNASMRSWSSSSGHGSPSSGSSHSVGQRQPHARSDDEFQPRARGEQLLEHRCVGCELLEVVEHEQHCGARAGTR